MTAIEYIVLGILAVLAAFAGGLALRNSGERAIQADIEDLVRTAEDVRKDEARAASYRETTMRAWEQHIEAMAKARREATERAWARHRAIYAPRQESHARRARKKS